MDPVLVIGGSGSLGHHIVQQLFSAGETDVTVFDIDINKNIIPATKYVQGSIKSTSDVLSILQRVKPRTIFHTASPAMLGQKNKRETFTSANITGTEILLENIKKVGVTKVLIYTSSSSVIHDNTTDLINATEDHPYCFEPEQKDYYAHTKAVAEKMILEANRKGGLLTASIRACLLFGEHDNAMPTQIGYAKSRMAKIQVGPGKNLVDWTYVGNCAHAHILAAQALIRVDPSIPLNSEDASKRVDGEAFVITNEEPWAFWEFPHTVGSVAGYPVKNEELWIVPTWLFYGIAVLAEWAVWMGSFGKRESNLNRKMVRYFTMTRTFDISKAKLRLGYRPLVSVREGIQRAVDAYFKDAAEGGKKHL